MAAAVQNFDDDAKPAAAGKRSRLRLVVMIALAAAVLGGAGAAYTVWFSPKKVETAETAPKPPSFMDVPDILVNLSTGAGERPQYLKVKVVLELPDASLTAKVQAMMPRVMDAFHVFLRELRPLDLEGSAGVYRLKEELTRRVNAAIAPARINAVLFKEMIVQ
jgi:flagellar FliL protein